MLASTSGTVNGNEITFDQSLIKGASRGSGVIAYFNYEKGAGDGTVNITLEFNDPSVDAGFYESLISTGALTFSLPTITGNYRVKLPSGLNEENIKLTVDAGLVDGNLYIEFCPDNPFFEGPMREIPTFIFDVQTTGVDDTFTLPLEVGGLYNFNVDWGDGQSHDITVWNHADTTHTYATADKYTIRITGTIQGWLFNWSGSATKVRDISSWGPLVLGNNTAYFAGCDNLTVSATDILSMAGTTDCTYFFYGCAAMTTIPSIDEWDMAAVTTMEAFFYECVIFNQDLSGWDISSCINMADMFYDCELFDGDIGSWNTGNVTDMSWMFVGADVFNQNLNSWDVSKVTTFEGTFSSADAFNGNISGWDTGAALTMANMLNNCWAFDQDLSGWNVESLSGVNAGNNFLIGVTLSTANYDALLIGWAAQTLNSAIGFNFGGSKYSAGAATAARLVLTDPPNSWVLSDGGQV